MDRRVLDLWPSHMSLGIIRKNGQKPKSTLPPGYQGEYHKLPVRSIVEICERLSSDS